jgi:hypothetical protein
VPENLLNDRGLMRLDKRDDLYHRAALTRPQEITIEIRIKVESGSRGQKLRFIATAQFEQEQVAPSHGPNAANR